MKSEMKLVLQHTTKVLTPHSLVRRAASEQVREAYQFGCGCWNSEGNKFNENDATRDFQIEGISSWQNSDSGSVEASSSSSRSKNGDPPSIIRLERVYYSTKTIPYQYHPPKLLCKAQCRVRVASSFNRVSSHNKNKSKRFAKKRVRLCMPKRKFSRFHKRPWPVRLKGKQIAALEDKKKTDWIW